MRELGLPGARANELRSEARSGTGRKEWEEHFMESHDSSSLVGREHSALEK